MKNFYFEMNPDFDMCYDYICEVAGCSSFVDDKKAWDMFYDAWDSFNMMDSDYIKTYPLFLNFLTYLHRLPNGKLTMHEGLPRELAIKRMEDHSVDTGTPRRIEVSSQQLFDDMFGG